jgi:hypothetical protein
MTSASAGFRGYIGAALFFTAAAIAMTYPLIGHLSDHVAGDASDPRYTMWVLSSNYRAVGGSGNLWSGNIFYPHTGTLYYGDPLIGLTLLGAPIRLLTRNPVIIYNILYLAAFFFSGFGMYALIRHLTSSAPAAFLAGFFFAFFPYSAAHISHLEILYFGWIPLCLLFMHRFFEKPSWGNVLGMAVFYMMMVQSCVYYGEFFTIFALLFVLYYSSKTGLWRTTRFWVRSAVFAALAASVLVPYALPFLRLHQRMLFLRPLWEIRFFSAQIQNYLAVPSWNRLWGSLLGRLGIGELYLYLGAVPTVLFIGFWMKLRRATRRSPEAPPAPHLGMHRWIIWDAINFVLLLWILLLAVNPLFRTNIAGMVVTARRLGDPLIVLLSSLAARICLDAHLRRRFVDVLKAIPPDPLFYTLTAGAAFLLSFGPDVRVFGQKLLNGPYDLLYRVVPGFRNLRVPARFVVLVMLGVVVVGAFASSAWLDKLRPGRRRAAVVVLLAAAMAEFVFIPLPLTAVDTEENIPAIYKPVAALPSGAALIELPMPARDHEEFNESKAVYYSAFHRKNIVNGYSGAAPPGYRIIREAMQSFPGRRTFELLENLDVQYVLIHTAGRLAVQGAEMHRRMAQFPERAELAAAVDGDFLYRILPNVETIRNNIRPALRPVGNKRLWRGEANLCRHLIRAAFDGEAGTFWTTGLPQSRGDYFQVDLGRVERFREINLQLQNNPLDFPRDFDVRVSLDGLTWTLLNRIVGGYPKLTRGTIEDFTSYKSVISRIPAEARFIRIRLIESHPFRQWSIAEINLLGD